VIGGFGLSLVLGRIFPVAMAEFLEGIDSGRRELGINMVIRMVLGWVTVWLYAAARFRLRSTTKTAIRVGLAVWFVLYVPQLWLLGSREALPWNALGVMGAWGIVETVVAAWAGGLVHQLARPDDARY